MLVRKTATVTASAMYVRLEHRHGLHRCPLLNAADAYDLRYPQAWIAF
jgi:hypothetical protein